MTYDLVEARAARDEALSKVARRRFMKDGLDAIALLPMDVYSGEDIRRELTKQGIKPHHHNAWGALIRHAVRRKLLEDTGSTTQMTAVRSHARRTPLYRRRTW